MRTSLIWIGRKEERWRICSWEKGWPPCRYMYQAYFSLTISQAETWDLSYKCLRCSSTEEPENKSYSRSNDRIQSDGCERRLGCCIFPSRISTAVGNLWWWVISYWKLQTLDVRIERWNWSVFRADNLHHDVRRDPIVKKGPGRSA